MKEVSALAKLSSCRRMSRPSRFVDDLHASPAWSAFEEEMGRDAIALSYCSDGFNPWHHNITAGNYSIWAQSGLILNLPPQIRLKKDTTMLFGLIAGPHAPKRLNVFNKIIVDELLELDQGISMYDASTKQTSTVRARVMFTVCDVPGNAKEHNRVQQNAKASCGHCHLKGVHSKILDKTVYPGGRIFLTSEDQLRQDSSFPTRTIEETAVVHRTREEEIKIGLFCDQLEHESRDDGTNNKTRFQAITTEHGRYGSSQWFRLPYLDMQQRNSPVEPMHAIKVVAEHITKLLNGDEDGPKVRAQERSMNRFVECCPDEVFATYVKEKKTIGQKRKRQLDDQSGNRDDGIAESNMEKRYPKGSLPPAPFTLTPEEKKLADLRLSSMSFPARFGDMPCGLFTHIHGGVKTHTWHQLFTNGVLRYCLRGMLGAEQRESLFNFLTGLETLFKSPTDLHTIDQFTEGWHVTLCRMERDFPLSLQSFVMHLLHHLPSYVKLYGPPSNFWMFPYERFNKTLSECITNSRNPELNAVKKMETHWLVTMLDCAGFLEPLRRRPEPRQPNLQYLQQGTYRPKPQQVNQVEREALTQLFGIPALTNQRITIFHYAKRQLGGSEVQYRDTSVENLDQREKACMVASNLPQGQFVGKVKYFLSYELNNDTHELVFVDWIGKPELCSDSKCFRIRRVVQQPPPLTWVSLLSAPLMHAWDEDVLWVPAL